MKLSSKGMSLITVLVTSTVAGIIGLFLTRMLSDAFKSQKFVQQKDDIQVIRRSLTNSMRCLQTLPGPAFIAANCDGVTPIRLKDGSDQFITAALETSGPLAGSAKFGDNFYVRTTCDNAGKTLDIRVARVRPDGTFEKDPIQKRDFDFTRPPNPIFGVSNPVCQEVLGTSTGGQQCGPNLVMTGINSDGSPNCKTIGQVMPQLTCTGHGLMVGINPDGSVKCIAQPAQSFAIPVTPGCNPTNPPTFPFCAAGANLWCRGNGWAAGIFSGGNGALILEATCIGNP